MVQTDAAVPAVEIAGQGRSRATRAGIKQAPLQPGCYVFRDADDVVLYIGKSIALRTRLASYFLPHRDGKTRAMLRHAQYVEWLQVASEVEALILELQLIKRHQPPYNVMLREYPHYSFVRLNDGGGFPYLELTSGVEADGTAYFGPFWGKRSAEQTLDFANRLFSLRRCVGTLPSPAEGRACFYAQTHKCTAPCLGQATGPAYGEQVRSAADLLRGDVRQLIGRLERERDRAAEQLRFEQAAELQSTIVTLQSLQRKRRHLRSAANTTNFLVVVRRPDSTEAQVLAFSSARLRGQVMLPGAVESAARPALQRFITEHYPVRRELAIDLDELDQMEVVADWLGRQGRRAAYIPLPDGPISAKDADRAVSAVAQLLAG